MERIDFFFSDPDRPQAPIITQSVNRTVTIQLKPVLPNLGPVSAYQIIVLDQDSAFDQDAPLKNFAQASKEKRHQYITAQLKPEVIQQNGFFNDYSVDFLVEGHHFDFRFFRTTFSTFYEENC